MKKKMLSLAAAITMAVVSLTGCSNGIKKDTVIKTAKEYGMVQQDKLVKAFSFGNDGYSVFYVSKDSEEADYIRKLAMHAGLQEDFALKETIACIESKVAHSKDEPGLSMSEYQEMRTTVIVMTAKDAKTAKKLYDTNAEWVILHEGEKGNKNGVEYTINYSAITTDNGLESENFYGIYLSGNTVIWIDAYTNVENIDDCTEYFCEKLGLVSPLTLR